MSLLFRFSLLVGFLCCFSASGYAQKIDSANVLPPHLDELQRSYYQTSERFDWAGADSLYTVLTAALLEHGGPLYKNLLQVELHYGARLVTSQQEDAGFAQLAAVTDRIVQGLGYRHPSYVLALKYNGDALSFNGQTNEGLDTLRRAVALAEELGEPAREEQLIAYSNLAMAERNAGLAQDGLVTYRAFGATLRPDDPVFYTEEVLFGQAICYAIIGREDEAIRYQLDGLHSMEARPPLDTATYVREYFHLGEMQRRANDMAAAEQSYRRALELAPAAYGTSSPPYAFMQMGLALVLSARGDYAGAINNLEAGREILANTYGKHFIRYAVALSYIAQNQQLAGRPDLALPKALNARRIIDRLDDNEIGVVVGAQLQLAAIYEQLDQPDSTYHYLQSVATYLRTRWENEVSRYSLGNQASVAEEISLLVNRSLSFALRHPDRSDARQLALDQALFRNGILLTSERRLRAALDLEDRPELEKTFAELQAVRTELGGLYKLAAANRPSHFDSLRLVAEQLERQLTTGSPLYQQSFARMSTPELRAALQSGEAYVELVALIDYPVMSEGDVANFTRRYAAMVVRPDRPDIQLVSLTTQADMPAPRRLRSYYAYADDSDNLYALMTAKLLPALEEVKTIYYSPDGALHRINFGALPVSPTETLADRFELHRLTSGQHLLSVQKDYAANMATLYGGVDYDRASELLVADADGSVTAAALADGYRGYRRDRWEALAHTKREVKTIAELLDKKQYQTDIRTGATATEASFKQLGTDGNSPRVLHLATHGYFFPKPSKQDSLQTGLEAAEHPLVRSGLILAGANAAWSGKEVAEGEEDGILTAYEIAQLDLSNTELVVLSACETGLGDIETGEGIYGLQRAFQLAGARYVLVSLWSVDDQRTAEFMTDFFRRHLSEGQSIPAAYQATQTAMRKRYNTPFNPRAWAGFVLLE